MPEVVPQNRRRKVMEFTLKVNVIPATELDFDNPNQ